MTEKHKNSLFSSLVCGTFQAVCFNPFDRALYLRAHHQTSIFDKKISMNPYQGFMNVAVYRILSGSLYFFLQDEIRNNLIYCSNNFPTHPIFYNFSVGFIAGSINGIVLNQFQIIKYQMWTHNSGNFFSVAKNMYHRGKIGIFFKGIKATILRDSIFGLSYEILRMSHITKKYDANVQFLCNMCAAMAAATASSFHNYCRSRIYAVPINEPTISKMFMAMYIRARKKKSISKKMSFLNSRLNIGLGTFRVGIGMASAQFIFNKIA